MLKLPEVAFERSGSSDLAVMQGIWPLVKVVKRQNKQTGRGPSEPGYPGEVTHHLVAVVAINLFLRYVFFNFRPEHFSEFLFVWTMFPAPP